MSAPHARHAADPIVHVEDAGDVQPVVDAVAAGGVEVVCLGAGVEAPLEVAQRMVTADPDVAVLILTDLEAAVAIDRQRELSPPVEADILLYTGEDVDAAQGAAAARTRARRDLRERPARRSPPAPADGRHLGRVLDTAPLAIVTLDRSGTLRGWNRRAEALFGGAAPGQPFDSLFPDEARAGLRAHLLAAAADDRGHAELFERIAADGSRQVLELAGGPLGAEGDDALMVLVQDVTDRVTAERRHRQTEDLLSAVVDSVPDAVFVKNRDSRYLLINRPGAAIWGRTPEQVVGRPIDEVVHPDAYERILANDRAVLESGQARTFDEESPGPPRRWYSSTKAPYYDHEGRIAGLVGISRDVTRRRLRETRAVQFDEATRAMTETLDPALGADRLAELVVRALADLCVVAVVDQPGHVRHMARAAAGPGDEALLDVLATLAPAGLTAREPRMVDAPHPRIRCAYVLPLPGAAATVGALIIGVTDTPLDVETRETAQELARRAGTALENARLHVERARIASTLQRSLLPPRLPSIPGISLAVRFRASGAGVEVGGDFYDVFPLDGGWAVAIGDVCGKGPEAAAVTALARYTIRALALRDERPEQILLGLNDALLAQRGGRDFCTAALLRLEGARVTVAGGGHPPPLALRADGSGGEMGRSGTLLGVLPDPTVPVHEATLAPGDAVILYTDGLNEASAPERLYTPEDLLEAARPAAGHSADAIAALLTELVPSAAEPRDDIAIVVLALDAA